MKYIVCLDDDFLTTMLLHLILKEYTEYKVMCINEEKDIPKEKFDLFIIDYHLQKSTSEYIIKREKEKNKEIKIMLLTGDSYIENLNDVDYIFHKPINKEFLIKSIKQLLES